MRRRTRRRAPRHDTTHPPAPGDLLSLDQILDLHDPAIVVRVTCATRRLGELCAELLRGSTVPPCEVSRTRQAGFAHWRQETAVDRVDGGQPTPPAGRCAWNRAGAVHRVQPATTYDGFAAQRRSDVANQCLVNMTRTFGRCPIRCSMLRTGGGFGKGCAAGRAEDHLTIAAPRASRRGAMVQTGLVTPAFNAR